MNARNMFVLTLLFCSLAVTISLYLWELRRSVVPNTQMEATHPVAVSAAGPAKQVVLWIAHDDQGTLQQQTASIQLPAERQQQAETLLRALVSIYTAKDSPHVLQSGAEVHNVYFLDPGLAVIDVNSSFADGQASGIFAEELTIASIVQTLATNFQGVKEIRLLVDGRERETLAGHVDTSAAFDVSKVAQLARMLSAQ